MDEDEDRKVEEAPIQAEAPTTGELYVDQGELILELEEAPPEEHGYGYGV